MFKFICKKIQNLKCIKIKRRIYDGRVYWIVKLREIKIFLNSFLEKYKNIVLIYIICF